MTPDDIWAFCTRKRYSAALTQYWMQHPWCAVCGDAASTPHHIRTRGAGGDDDAANLLSLCTEHHNAIHSLGIKHFAFVYPVVSKKLKRARERAR